MNSVALYQALKAANVSDDLAARAAEAVPVVDVAQLVTKDELRAAVAGLEAKIERQTVQVLGGVALLLGLFSAVGKFL